MTRRKLGFALLLAGLLLAIGACTDPAVTKPDPFTFPAVQNAEPGAVVTSAAATIKGLTTKVAASVTAGGTLIVNGTAAGATAQVGAGDKVAVRLTASSSFSTKVSATVDIGGVKADFEVTTRAASTQPDAFQFAPVDDAARDSLVTSDPVTITGLDAPVTATIAGDGNPALLVNGVAGLTVENNDEVSIELTTGSDFSTAYTATLTIGGVSADFVVTTRAPLQPMVTLDTDPSGIVDATPGQTLTLRWTVTGDYDSLELTSSVPGDAPVDVTTLTSYDVTVPGNAASVQYVLTARLPEASFAVSDSTDVQVPLWVCENNSDVITLPDPGLNARFRALPGMPASGPITCANARAVLVFPFGNWAANLGDVESLVGLQHFANLRELRAAFNEVSDVTPLAGLTSLRVLDLDANRVTDVSPLAGLTGLTELGLWDNGPVRIDEAAPGAPVSAYCYEGISDISPLAGLTNLEVLYLSCNNLTDVSALAGMTRLEVVFFNFNRITDITPLANLHDLRILRTTNNAISTAGNIFAGMPDLAWLELEYNSLGNSAIAGLAGLQNLWSVGLEGNYFSSLASLTGNAAFPAAAGTGFENEPATPTVTLGWNCLADPDGVATALEAKGVTVTGVGFPQRAPAVCALFGAGTSTGVSVASPEQVRERARLR